MARKLPVTCATRDNMKIAAPLGPINQRCKLITKFVFSQPPPVPPVPPPAKYQFGYSVSDDYGNEYGHEESRNGDSAHGMFSVLLPDGRKQIVRYRADAKGYHPTITYEPAKRRAPISSTLSGPY